MSQVPESAKTGVELPSWLMPAAGAAAAVGVAGTALGLAGAGRAQTWWMLLVNFLFWGGIAQGLFTWSAVFRTAQATWTPALNRLGHAVRDFLPLSLLFYILLWSGREHWLTWLHHPVHGKEAWLNEPFFFWRDLGLLAALALLGYALVGAYRRGETASEAADVERAHRRANRLATTLVILYACAYTVLAFDLVMSLAPHWYSSLLGGYFFVSNLYLSMAALILVAALVRHPLGLAHLLGPRQFRDMGNLMLGFGLLTTGFFFAQYLTIWYGNLPEETSYLIIRSQAPWRGPGIAILAAGYLGPFLLLCFPAVKKSARLLCAVSLVVLAGMWIERWVLVVPSLSPERLAGLGPLQWAIPVGFAGLLALVVTASLRRRPGVWALDTALERSEGVVL